MPPDRRVVLLACEGDSTRAVYAALAARVDVVRVILETSVSRAEILKRRAKRIGVRRASAQAAFAGLVVPALRVLSKERLRELRARVGADAWIPEDRITRVGSVNDAECIRALSEIGPSVVVVNGTRIVSERVLSAIDATFINMHAGITPRYRGTHGAYWAYAEGRPAAAGVTVHLVDKGIDTGGILGQARIAREPADTFVTLPYLQLEAGIPLLLNAVDRALAGRVTPTSSIDDGDSKLWYHPGIVEYARNWLTRGVR